MPNMAEQLEQQVKAEPVGQAPIEATTPADNGGAQAKTESEPQVEVPEWKTEIQKLQEAHQREIQALKAQNEKLQHGMDKTFGKLRQKVTGIKNVVDTLVPEPKREQFKTDAEYQQAQQIVKPIRDQIVKNEQEIEKAEREAEEQAEKEQYLNAIGSQIGALPQEDSARIFGKYNQAVQKGEAYDIDKDMLAFVASSKNGAQILDALYDNPESVATLKRMSPSAKMAALVNLALTVNQVTTQAAPSLLPMQAQTKVTPPAIPTKTGGGASSKQPIHASSAQEYLQMRLGRKI